MDVLDAEILEGSPVADRYLRVAVGLAHGHAQRRGLLVRKLRAQVGDHGVVTSHHTGIGGHRKRLAVLHVRHRHARCIATLTRVTHPDDGGVQADPYGARGKIELRIAHRRSHRIVHRAAG